MFDTLSYMICVIAVVAIKFPKVKPVLLIGAISNKVILTKQVIVLGKRYSIAELLKKSRRFIFLMKHKI